MIVRRGDTYLGVLGLMDTPREAAKNVIARLRELGIRRMIMLSGDNQQVASAVAKEVGLDEAWGDLMPDDKVAAIKKLSKQEGVAMLGDGVNDAPAMANATVGIAMGAAGSDVALETADVALMADDLNHLPFVIGLSRQTSRIIRQNLWLSLGMLAFLVPATVLGLRLVPTVVLHEGSTLLVVFNALRLLAYPANAASTSLAWKFHRLQSKYATCLRSQTRQRRHCMPPVVESARLESRIVRYPSLDHIPILKIDLTSSLQSPWRADRTIPKERKPMADSIEPTKEVKDEIEAKCLWAFGHHGFF